MSFHNKQIQLWIIEVISAGVRKEKKKKKRKKKERKGKGIWHPRENTSSVSITVCLLP